MMAKMNILVYPYLFIVVIARSATALSLSLSLSLSPSPSPPTSTSRAAARQLAANWFSISSHLQDPTLYDAEWANACQCHYDDDSNTLITSRDVQRGEILSLLPIHAIGLKGQKEEDDWIVFDRDQDTEYSSSFSDASTTLSSTCTSTSTTRTSTSTAHRYKYDISKFLELPQTTQHTVPMDIFNAMYCNIHPSRPIRNGWMGHLAAEPTSSSSLSSGNCCILAVAPPVCGLFASQDIQAGMPLLLDSNQDERTTQFFFNHRAEIEALQNYMVMAYPKADQTQNRQLQEEDNAFKYPFYNLPREYPNLKELHSNPDILAIPNFLTDAECDSLIAKAKPHLVPCLTKNPTTGQVEADPSRTSENANIPQSEVPSAVAKLTRLANCTAEHLEILQVLHYKSGQYFEPHTDGFSGPITACGFYDSARLVTIFCYLNDVEAGGATRFGDLGLDVEPQRGMAVLHFPTTLGFEEDVRTQHEGAVAIDDKWLLVTWVWMHPREQRSIYAEKWLDPLDEARI
jgi:hypothetical protein